MKEKTLLFLFVSLFSISAFAQDMTHAWNPGENENTTYKWTETANWFIGAGEGYPNDIEAANVEIGNGDYPAVGEVIVDAAVSVFNIKVGNGGEEEAVLRIVKGGNLTTGKWWSGIGWSSPGKLIVEKGAEMTFGEHMWIGWDADAVAQIEGTVNVTAMYGGGAFGNVEGVSNTFVKNGGVLNLSQLNPDKSFTEGSFIDIAGGTLNFKIGEDGAEAELAKLQTFIDNENIVSYEGNGELTLTVVGDTNIVVTAASVVYQVNLSEVTDMKEGGKVFVMLGDGSDYEEMTDENGDGIYIASITADRAADLTYWFEYENASARTIEDLTGKDCASGSKRAIAAAPENSVLTLPAFLFNSCDEAAEKQPEATTEWTGAVSGLWSVEGNWSDEFVPNDNKVVFNNPDAPDCILNIESTIKTFVLGDGGEASTLTVTDGGTLTTTAGWSGIGWTAPAAMVVEEGGAVNFAEHAWIGWESDATLTIDGGTVNVAGMFGTAFEGGAGTATTSVIRGTLNLTEFDAAKSIPEGSILDISAGTVTIVGDHVASVTAYAEAGRMTAYSGQGVIVATLSGDTTIVTAAPARQETTVWDPASNPESTGLWTEAANWTDSNTPLDNVVMFNIPDAAVSMLNDSAVVKKIVMGDGGPGGVLKVTDGGTLTTTESSALAVTENATLIVETGAKINFGADAWIGGDADAILQINGGTVNVAGMYGTAGLEGQMGKGFVTVNSGALNLTGFDAETSIPDTSFIDIKLGTLTIEGDQTAAVNAYAEDDKITAYGGNGELSVVFADGVTTVTATTVSGSTAVWNPAGNPESTGLWTEALNWSNGLVPDDNKVVTNVPDAADAVLDTTSTIKQFVLGDGADGGTVRVANGGTLTTTSGWSGVAWTHDAALVVETGGTVNFAEHAWIGWDGNATLTIDGGTVNVAGMFGTAFEGQAGTGTTKVKGGVLNLTGFDAAKSIPDGSVMDIELGVVNIKGDMVEVVNAYVDAGKITAFGGAGTLQVTFADDVTTILAIPEASGTTVWDPSLNPGISTGMWTEAMNWSDRHVPSANKVVFNVTGAIEATLNDSSVITQLVLGDGGEGMQTLRIADGGVLSTTNGWSGIGWNTPGTLIVETGGVFNFGSHAWIGWNSDAVVEINGGVVNVGGMYGTAFDGQSGTGSVYVNSGEFNLTGFDPAKSIPEGSILDIEEGKVTIPGDHVAVAKAYVDLGRITGYGGNGQVFVTLIDSTTTLIEARDWAVSVAEIDNGVSSKVYPNPTHGRITIDNTSADEFSFSIYNLTGKLMLQRNNISSPTVEADMSDYKTGMYFIQVRSEKGSKTHKVILK